MDRVFLLVGLVIGLAFFWVEHDQKVMWRARYYELSGYKPSFSPSPSVSVSASISSSPSPSQEYIDRV